jgi:hypothetical protein
MLYNQVVTRGEASMAREAATGESGVRLPNGELMTPEKFMSKTKMLNQCTESLHTSEKKSRLLAEENTNLKKERDSLYTNMRKFENMLMGFERARHYDAFTDESHKAALEENSRLVDQIEELQRNEREKSEENSALRRRVAYYKQSHKRDPRRSAALPDKRHDEDEEQEPDAAIPRKRSHHMSRERRQVIGSDDEDDPAIEAGKE